MSLPTPRDASSPPILWWPLFLIVLTGGGLLYAVQGEGFSFVQPARDFGVIVGLINLLVYLWIRTCSRLSRTHQIVIVTSLFAIQMLLVLMFRLDEYSGDGRILFRWRWTASPEQRLAEYASKTAGRNTIVDLTEIRETDSPSFRGADRTGRYRVADLEWDWNQHVPRELWRHPVGRGWSSFAVVGGFGVTQEQRDSFEGVVCYDLRTGNEIWKHLDQTRFDEVTSGPGPRATPTIHAGRIFSFGATGILNCLNGSDGHVIWSHDFSQRPAPLFGHASSPLLYGNRVFVTPGGEVGSIVALDADSGETLWSQDSRKPGYSSPVLFQTTSEDQILVFDATGLHGYEAETGDRRWTFPWGDNSDDQVNVCQPAIVAANESGAVSGSETPQLLISSGYGRGSALLSIKRTADGEWAADAIWRTKTLKSKFSDLIVYGKHAYGLDEGILTCISLSDGTRRWKNGRYGYGQLILVNQMLLIQTEAGRIALVRPDPNQFSEVTSLDALHERTWNQPVVAGQILLVRSDREAVCFELPSSRLQSHDFRINSD